jgi:hypothetical protein
MRETFQTKHQARLEEVTTAIVDLDEALAELVREAQPIIEVARGEESRLRAAMRPCSSRAR